MNTELAKPVPSAIRRVSYYRASPVETCCRCGQGIAHVFAVVYKDENRAVYGSECINRVLAGDTSLKSLWRKNVKLLQARKAHLDILELGENAPRGNEYYGSGMFFVVDHDGQAIGTKAGYIWHPVADVEKNLAGSRYVMSGTQWTGKRDAAGAPLMNTPEEFRARALAGMEAARVEFRAQIAGLEAFLARVLMSARAKGFDL